MRIPNATFKKSGVVALFAVVSLMMTNVGPASALTVGAGAGDGWEYPPELTECDFPFPLPPDIPPMTPVIPAGDLAYDRFELSHYGTLDAVTPSSNPLFPTPVTVASYLGDTDMSITVDRHMVSPLGTHADPDGPGNACPTNPVPTPIDIDDVYITGEAEFLDPTNLGPFLGTRTGFVECGDRNTTGQDDVTGSYIRIVDAVVFDFVVDCRITGNVYPFVGAVSENVHFVIEGTMNPCFLFPPLEIMDNPECGVFEDPEPQGAGSHLVTAYEALPL